MTTNSEQRIAERFPLQCLIEFDRGKGWSRDISASGVYFSTEQAFSISEKIRLIIHPGHSPMIRCDGQVVRTENQASGFGVAVQFKDFVFETA